MASQIGPNLNLNHTWLLNEDGWNIGMDENLIKLDTIVHLSVKSKSISIPPISPTNGDRYIIASNPINVWSNYENYITVYINNTWKMYNPRIGFIVYIEDLNKLNIFNGIWCNIGMQAGVYQIDGTNQNIIVNWDNGSTQCITLSLTNHIVSFINPYVGQVYRIKIIQDSIDGFKTIGTWPSIKWANGVVPVLTTAAGKCDIITLVYDSEYCGDINKNF